MSATVWRPRLGAFARQSIAVQQLFFGRFLGIAAEQQRHQPRTLPVIQQGTLCEQLRNHTLLLCILQGGNAGLLGVDGGALVHMLIPALAALVGITAGTLYQKRYCPRFDLRTGSVLQFLPSLAITALIASQTETMVITWSGDFVFALGWLVLVLSVGAISLLNLLIRSGSAVNVASLFYLTPPTTALIAWAMFGETLSALAIAGMALAVSGVWLARKG